jgi:hypothetical protein
MKLRLKLPGQPSEKLPRLGRAVLAARDLGRIVRPSFGLRLPFLVGVAALCRRGGAVRRFWRGQDHGARS